MVQKKSSTSLELGILARPRVLEAIQEKGLHCTDLFDNSVVLQSSDFTLIDTGDLQSPENKSVAATHNIFLVCVKSADTQHVAEILLQLSPQLASSPSVVISCQNGSTNAKILQSLLPPDQFTVLTSVVGFNVIWEETHHVHKATTNPFVIESVPRSSPVHPLLLSLQTSLKQGGCKTLLSDNIEAVQWGKICINLNNAVNALAGTTLVKQFDCEGYRHLFALQIHEALRVLHKKQIPVGGPLPPSLLAHLLCAPQFFMSFAKNIVIRIDEKATSSMQQDLKNQRATEVNELQGKILSLGETVAISTPVIATLKRLVEAASEDKKGSPQLSDAQIFEAVYEVAPKSQLDSIVSSYRRRVYFFSFLFLLFLFFVLYCLFKLIEQFI